MDPFIFLAGMVIGVLVTLLAATLADRLPPDGGDNNVSLVVPEEQS